MAPFGEILSSGEVRFERMLPGTVERVWRYLTEASLLATWLGDADCDLQPLTHCTFHFDRLGRDVRNDTTIVSVDLYQPPFRLECSWQDRPMAGRSSVSIALQSSGPSSVQLTLRHIYLGDAHIDALSASWHTHLDILYSRLIGVKIPSAAFDAIFDRVLPAYERSAETNRWFSATERTATRTADRALMPL